MSVVPACRPCMQGRSFVPKKESSVCTDSWGQVGRQGPDGVCFGAPSQLCWPAPSPWAGRSQGRPQGGCSGWAWCAGEGPGDTDAVARESRLQADSCLYWPSPSAAPSTAGFPVKVRWTEPPVLEVTRFAPPRVPDSPAPLERNPSASPTATSAGLQGCCAPGSRRSLCEDLGPGLDVLSRALPAFRAQSLGSCL